MRRRTRAAVVLFLAIGILCALTSLAEAELTARGDLFVSFKGGIAPTGLPRHELAPISVSVSGTVRTPPGSQPPPLRQIKIAINRNGRLDTTGLPSCRASQIEGTTSAQAMGVCGDARVGSGVYSARTSFPEQGAFPVGGRILAFNAKSEGRPAILVHIYGTSPAPSTSIITLYVRRLHGTYGTQLNGFLPPSLSHYRYGGYVRRISLTLHRTYTYKGRRRSYLSAACAAPAGFPGATFPFARASMRFEGGTTLTSTLVRSCRVAG